MTSLGGGLANSRSFEVNLPTAGDTSSIEIEAPYSAIDARYNLTTINYVLFDHTSTVLMEILDWNDNVVNSVHLQNTGSGAAIVSNLRYGTAKVDYNLPFLHGNTDTTIKIRFSSDANLASGAFYFNFIQSDYDPRAIGQWVEVNSVSLAGSGGETITADTENIVFNGTGAGWNSGTYEYTAQRSDGVLEFNGNIDVTDNLRIFVLYKNGSTFRIIGTTASFGSENIAVKLIGGVDYVSGDIFSFRVSSGNTTLNTLAIWHYMNITETVNRRSIMSEVETSGLSYTPTFTGFGTVTDIDVRYNLVGNGYFIYGEFTAGTTTATEAQMTLPNGALVDGGINALTAGTWYREAATTGKGGSVIMTDGDDFVNFSAALVFSSASTAALTPADGSSVLTSNDRMSFQMFVPIRGASTKQIISIPVDEIIADGNEYAVFGKFITLADGTKYQVYKRNWRITSISGNGTNIDTIPSGLVGISPVIQTTANFWHFSDLALGASYVTSRYTDTTGDVSVVANTYSYQVGNILEFIYYDPARPLN